ncbi:hypothetical protein UT300005_20980 [Clostridium sp. CTA-5]
MKKHCMRIILGVSLIGGALMLNPISVNAAESNFNAVKSTSLFEAKVNGSLPVYFSKAPDKWKDSKIEWDGETGNYVTTYMWVSGSNLSREEKKAVKNKYGTVEKNYEYKMETKQHIVQAEFQTQGYITISTTATCYGRR